MVFLWKILISKIQSLSKKRAYSIILILLNYPRTIRRKQREAPTTISFLFIRITIPFILSRNHFGAWNCETQLLIYTLRLIRDSHLSCANVHEFQKNTSCDNKPQQKICDPNNHFLGHIFHTTPRFPQLFSWLLILRHLHTPFFEAGKNTCDEHCKYLPEN